MKILNKRGLQQIVINHSSDFDYEDFKNLYKKCPAKPYSFLVIDTAISLDNLLRFKRNPLESIWKHHENWW